MPTPYPQYKQRRSFCRKQRILSILADGRRRTRRDICKAMGMSAMTTFTQQALDALIERGDLCLDGAWYFLNPARSPTPIQEQAQPPSNTDRILDLLSDGKRRSCQEIARTLKVNFQQVSQILTDLVYSPNPKIRRSEQKGRKIEFYIPNPSAKKR